MIKGAKASWAGVPRRTSRPLPCISFRHTMGTPTRASKRTTSWLGLKVHLETTTAPVSEDARTATIHEGLKQKELLPDQHIVETGYVDAQLLHRSQQDDGIDLLGATRADYKWQAQQQSGFDAGKFQINWQAKQATCPEGSISSSGTPAIDNRQNEVIKIKFATKDCQCCPSRPLCTPSTPQRRTITVRPEQHYQALQQARERAKTDDFKTLYARRAGGEGTISKASSRQGSASLSLYRPRENPSPASCNRCCHQCRWHCSLARWPTSR